MIKIFTIKHFTQLLPHVNILVTAGEIKLSLLLVMCSFNSVFANFEHYNMWNLTNQNIKTSVVSDFGLGYPARNIWTFLPKNAIPTSVLP